MISFSSGFLFDCISIEKLSLETHIGEESLSSSGVSIGTEVPGNGWTNTELFLKKLLS
jgi:hypothetical protein